MFVPCHTGAALPDFERRSSETERVERHTFFRSAKRHAMGWLRALQCLCDAANSRGNKRIH
jgi:hypothetical protein